MPISSAKVLSHFHCDNMASNLRQQTRLNYKCLNEGPIIKFNKSVSKSQSRVLEGSYFVDRIIWRREDREKKVSTVFIHIKITINFTLFAMMMFLLHVVAADDLYCCC